MEVADRAVVLRQGRYVGEETPTQGDPREARRDDRRRRRDGDASRRSARLSCAAWRARRAAGPSRSRGCGAPPERRGPRRASSPSRSTRSTGSTPRRAPRPRDAAASPCSRSRPAPTPQIVEQIDIVENLLAQDVDALVDRAVGLRPAQAGAREGRGADPGRAVRLRHPGLEAQDRLRRHRERGRRRRRPASTSPSCSRTRGTLAIISGIPGSEVGIERVDGVKKGLEEAGGKVEIVKEVTGQFDREQAVGAMEDILQTEPRRRRRVRRQRPDGARRDPGDRGAQQDRGHQADRLRRRARGDPAHPRRRHARDDRPGPVRHGQEGVEQALAKLAGKEVKRTVNTGAKLITPDNARDYFEEVRGQARRHRPRAGRLAAAQAGAGRGAADQEDRRGAACGT